MHVKIIKTTFTILFCTFLTACMNLGQLNYKQVHMLKKEGFSLTNEGWTLALPEKLCLVLTAQKFKNHTKHHSTDYLHNCKNMI